MSSAFIKKSKFYFGPLESAGSGCRRLLFLIEKIFQEFLKKYWALIKIGIIMGVGLNLVLSSYYLYLTFDQNYFLSKRIMVSRSFLINIIGHLLIFFIIFYRNAKDSVRRFFLEPTHPNNLSIFRIVFFWYFFNKDFSYTITLSKNPDIANASWHLPQWFIDVFPLSEPWVTTAAGLFRLFAFMACIGLFTRLSCWGALLTGFYVLGAPQYLGKLNHYHHEFWFLAILAVSRCGDTLSCDSLINAARAPKQKTGDRFSPPSPSVVYALPLRFIWILIGILYFFPGFWKMWGGGLDWIVSGQLKNSMYYKWMSYQIVPPFRIDHYPFLLGISAALVVLFEMGFIVLIFSSRLRFLAVIGGLIFHKTTSAFMGIYFSSLVMCYVAFFDWQMMWDWFRKKFFPGKKFFPKRLQYFWGDQGNASLQNGYPKMARTSTPYAVILCGAILVLGNAYYGFTNRHSWPFSCYPTFMEMTFAPYTVTLSIDAFDRNHKRIDYNKNASYFYADNLRELLVTLSHEWDDKSKTVKRLKDFFKLCGKNDPILQQAAYVHFYLDTLDMTPEKLSQNPVKREQILELRLQPGHNN